MANPTQAVIGYLTAAVAYIAIPLLFSFTFGISYMAYSVRTGSPAVSLDAAMQGESHDQHLEVTLSIENNE
jgi:hypothetical protein